MWSFVSFVSFGVMIRTILKTRSERKYRFLNRSRVRVCYIIKQMNLNSRLTFFFFFFFYGCFLCDGLKLHFFFFLQGTNARIDKDRGSIEPTRHGVFIHRYKYEWTPVVVKRVVDLFFGFPCDVTAPIYINPRLAAVGDERGEKKKKKIHT